MAVFQGLQKKVRQNAAHHKSGRTKKRYKELDRAPKYISPTLTYQHKKDYSFKKDQQVRVLTLEGRAIVPYMGYNHHIALIQKGAEERTRRRHKGKRASKKQRKAKAAHLRRYAELRWSLDTSPSL